MFKEASPRSPVNSSVTNHLTAMAEGVVGGGVPGPGPAGRDLWRVELRVSFPGLL